MNLKKKKRDYFVFRKHLTLIIIFVIFLFIILAGIYIFLSKESVCGDGAKYDSCSDRKPYFCEQGTLIEKASICGCFENLTIGGDSCISEYQTEMKNINLNYVLRGEEETLSFVVYGGLTNYLLKLSRSISNVNGEVPTKADFKLKKLDEETQRYFLLPLVTKIQNLVKNEKDQVRIAVSIVQKISFSDSLRKTKIGGDELNYARYPYEILYDEEGICSEKAELLVFILREMGYGVAFFYYPLENHEAVAVKCPRRNSVGKTGYCFVETTGPAIMTDDEIEYSGIGKLSSEPELIVISEGKSIGNWWYEFRDANGLIRIRNAMERNGMVGALQFNKFEKLSEKYGLEKIYNP